MGAWGPGNWENDHALDWVADLHEWRDVEAALAGPLSHAGSCCRALAAAEVVAACVGRSSRRLPDGVEAWVAQHGAECAPDLRETAAKIVSDIGSRSELRSLFDDGGRNAEWHAIVEELRARLLR